MKNLSQITENEDISTKKYVDDGLAEKSDIGHTHILRGTAAEYADAVKDEDTFYYTTDGEKFYIGSKEISGGSSVTIDDALSDTSENPVQNKVVKAAINNKADKTVATIDTDGLMSASDKTKLDNANDVYASKSKYGDTTINVGRKTDSDIGANSVAEGINATASGDYSHAEGCGTEASGDCSHAEGENTTARGSNSHAEGLDTIASGYCSHAGGDGSQASGASSFSHGTEILTQLDNEVAFGKYNIQGGLFSIGDGISDGERHNAFEVTTDGGKLHDKNIATEDDIPVEMTGATSNTNGVSGLVPAPTIDDITKFLCGNGTWKEMSGGEKGGKGDKGEKGDTGEKGDAGVDGITYIPTIGEVTTVDSNELASASVSVNTETKEAVFNFAIPKGNKGLDGVQISDNETVENKTWSSSKIASEIPTSLPANGGNADTVNNHTVESDVPTDAKFTDTIYDDTEIKGNIEELEYSEVAGGKNVFDISKIDLLGVEYRNGVYTNKITDSRTFFNACIDYWNDDGHMITYPNESFRADDKGRYSITGKIIEGCTKIRFKHNGATADIVFFITPISYFGLEVGDTFTISVDVDGYNPSTAGGLIVKNIQIEKGSSATPYKPYIPSVKMLAEEVNQQKIELQNVDERVTIKDNGSFIINGFAFVNLLVTFNETLPQWSNFVRLPRPKGGNVSVHCENSVRFTIYSQDSAPGDCETYKNVSSGTEIRLLVNYEVA